MHTLLILSSDSLPDGHFVHALDPALVEKLPIGQVGQLVVREEPRVRVRAYFPAGQAMHTLTVAEAETCPNGQDLHDVSPAVVVNCPEVQVRQ